MTRAPATFKRLGERDSGGAAPSVILRSENLLAS